MNELADGYVMHEWMKSLFPINRSLAGEGNRQTLKFIRSILPALRLNFFKSGDKVFDWTVPMEWKVLRAQLKRSNGDVILDFQNNNLHLVGYSRSVHAFLTLTELENHIYTSKEIHSAIPYVTSYYSPNWGFCISEEQKKELADETYEVDIRTEFIKGKMDYGEIFIKGQSADEIFFSTYICHPSMANNELSGPVVAMALALWLQSKTDLYFSYRIIFIPETIGAIAYISKNLSHLKKNVRAGLVLTCMGDDRGFSYLPTRPGNTLSDRAARYLVLNSGRDFSVYSFLDRGSDERQYCSPGVDLPICSLMRTKYGEYPEYHTSADDLDLVTPSGLQGGLDMVKDFIEILEMNRVYKNTVLCEPQLGKRGLYPQVSTTSTKDEVATMMDFLAYADGSNDLLSISELVRKSLPDLNEVAIKLRLEGLVSDQCEETKRFEQ